MKNVCEQCRRSGDKLMLKGARCVAAKCAMVKRPYGPGMHGATENTKKSEYGRQLQEKQKTREIYGIREKQFRLYVGRAEKTVGNTAENLLKLLELRLDNVVYRMNIASSRAQARQMVNHGLIKVNGSKLSIPSYTVKIGDIIGPKTKEKYEEVRPDSVASWIEFDQKKIQGKIKNIPVREEIDTPINENLIIEFYSR